MTRETRWYKKAKTEIGQRCDLHLSSANVTAEMQTSDQFKKTSADAVDLTAIYRCYRDPADRCHASADIFLS